MMQFSFAALGTADDRAKFDRLYDMYHNRLLKIAFNMLHSQAKAEDAVQDAFLKIWAHFEQISKIPRNKLDAWIVTILKNSVLDQLRKERLHWDADPEAALANLPDPRQDTEGTAAYHCLLEAIRRLPPDDRALLERKLVLEWSNQEIAKAMGLSANAVGVRIHRAKERLRKQLEKEGLL